MFHDGMKASIEQEENLMGETISVKDEPAQAVVNDVDTSQPLRHGQRPNDTTFVVFISHEEKERLGIKFHTKIKLNDRGGYSGRVNGLLLIEGGQWKLEVGPSKPKPSR